MSCKLMKLVTYVMTVDAIVNITILSTCAGIQTCQKSNGSLFRFTWAVFVFKTACIALGTRTPKVMVVAEFVVVFSLLDIVQRTLVHF